ncbi:hypothetical protein [Thermomonospora cellulosilytica]|uniref:Uncharacterized protein n=1 Tax=Thermomonospora cellulosilytica TaxID=1411118 RepID=A0A7W3MVF9_9ACTN|nr:hypothetical protein [Thermomonospora cellulosilytica]MBA9002630.1 hypothetical protein [Thermomonospora cellulosilytica]
MSFDKGRHAAGKGEEPVLTSDRRIFVRALDEAVRSRPGVACGIVTRQGIPVLHAINSEMPSHSVEVGADYVGGDWRYTWARTGDAIGPVDDPESVADAIVAALKVNGRGRS